MAAETVSDTETDWPLRPWLLAGLLALAGLLVHLASDDGTAETVPWRMALTALAFFAPLAAAFTLDRNKYVEPGIFAAIVGLVMAGIAWRATSAGDHYSDEQFWVATGVISVGLAVPLFQSNFHRRRFAVPYREIHFNVWTDALSAAGALAFTGLSWALLFVLDQLFQLVGITLIDTLVKEGWFAWMYSGAAFGAGLGTLRNELKILATLQSVAMLVLSILAVPLAVGLLVFVVALILTGGNALWNATDSATPVLLACAIGAFVLSNAILRDGDDEMTGNRVLRIAALVLSLAILPLTVFAAISMGVRIGQHGLSPERLWGLVAVTVAIAYGLAYLIEAIRGRKAGWRDYVRRANLHLAVATCGVAFLLALPIFNFGSISANNQLARLERGEVAPDKFDFAALRWDFGDAGRKALATLAKSGNAKVAELAKVALAEDQRVYRAEPLNKTRADFALRVQPDDPELRELVLDYLVANPYRCETRCVALDLGVDAGGKRLVALIDGSGWFPLRLPDKPGESAAQINIRVDEAQPELKPNSTVEVREFSRRYIVVDGKPMGQPLDELEGTPAPR
jgi:hypothetical protein